MFGYALVYKDADGFRHILEDPHSKNLLIFVSIDCAYSKLTEYEKWIDSMLNPEPIITYKIKFLRYGKRVAYNHESEFKIRLYQRIKNTLSVEKVKVI